MIVRKCDRCGEELNRCCIVKRYIYTRECEDGFEFRTDLCPKCFRKLKKFLKGTELRGEGETDGTDE